MFTCPPAKINKKEAVSSTIAPLSSLAKNLGLHKPSANKMGYTNPEIFMESKAHKHF
jgi:hypothetical protein